MNVTNSPHHPFKPTSFSLVIHSYQIYPDGVHHPLGPPYHVDCSLFARMVMQLSCDPAESLLAMAFWFWLKDKNFPCLVKSLIRASDFVVNKVIDEAIFCLNSLAPDQPMSLIANTYFTAVMMQSNVPPDVMHRDKSLTISGIKHFLKHVYSRTFTDILRQVTAGDHTEQILYQRLNISGFPHPVFGDVPILDLPLYQLFPLDNLWMGSMAHPESRPPHQNRLPMGLLLETRDQ
ncbi:hypothetical protein Cgig2_023903 [Carnegiea gigantea]|uniref:Uncharacterized protein n=1 Tax=Carnegiea gigantea TaxID=171969 RepID=A0A9Q1GK74_9CARY|nr:hypothetical protein Cgig2_023398 [Carnegiea gigantea]KAJ8425487.1 hypothetical protein Cgig2_023903 [Carnegiea gigantea]